MTQEKNVTKGYSGIVMIIIVIVVFALGYSFLTAKDTRTTSDKVSDAIDELPQGTEKAARQLEDRTPGQKLGDAVKDTGEKIKDETGAQ